MGSQKLEISFALLFEKSAIYLDLGVIFFKTKMPGCSDYISESIASKTSNLKA